jgi:magnesium transporter
MSNEIEDEEFDVNTASSVGRSLMDSKTSHLDDELSDRLEEAFHKTTFNIHLHDVAKIASEYNPIDLAYAACHLPPNARYILYENLPDIAAKSLFIINTDSSTRSACFRYLHDDEIKSLIEQMPIDEAVWVLDDMPERRCRRVFEKLDPKRVSRIKELQKHSRNSAGGLMTSEFFAFSMDTTIAEAAKFIRENPGIDETRRIFVLDDKGALQGYVPARNLIVNVPHLPLRQVMRNPEHTVYADTTREEVVDIVERYKIPALPVVDLDNILVGVITYENVVEAIEDIADETIAFMGGTAEDISALDHVFRRFLSRAPWLMVTLVGGLISASIMAYYQGLRPELLAVIFFFIPLINGMSGNVGIQCSTVLVRSMAIGVLTSGKRGEAVVKEVAIGLITGTFFGALCGLVVYFLSLYGIGEFNGDPLHLGIMISIGLLGASLTATILGVGAPFFFVRMGVDPALASGPIVTAFNDIMSMIIFFLISGILNAFFF